MAKVVKAFAAKQPGLVVEPVQLELAPLGYNDVEIKISHCGICHSDIHLNKGEWGPWSSFEGPGQISGHEIVGHVAAVGQGVTGLKAGQRVGVGWYKGACGDCRLCMADDHGICPANVATCAGGNKGGFAEAIRVPAAFAFAIPEALPSEAAAPMLCGGITVYSPLVKFSKPTSHVAVVGIGGLGAMAIQFAKARGSTVTAVSTSPNKEQLAKELGADKFLVSTDPAAIKAFEDTFDLVIVTVSAPFDAMPLIACIKANGTMCFVGAVTAPQTFVPFGPVLMKQINITGSVTGGRGRITEMLKFAADHNIRPAVEQFKFDEINTALAKVDKNEVRFRAVLHF